MKPRLPKPLAAWFADRYPGGFSQIQKVALPHTMEGRNTLILAPTGSGKTLAALLSVIARMVEERELGDRVHAVYVSPLRSLTRDIHRNLTELGERFGIRMDVRTGDTEAADRARQQRRPPHLLLTTPESLSALLAQKSFAGRLTPRTVIVDEVHSFAENKRGSLLSLTLERLQLRAPNGQLQRIGLSATAWPVEAVQRLLCGRRECAVAVVDIRKSHRLRISPLREDTVLPAAGFSPYKVAFAVADHLRDARCTLIFTATRSAAERLGLALKIILPQWDDLIEVHHASVDRETRLRIEDGLSAGGLKAVVCSTSLELGVDFAAVDQVLLIGAPRGVSRAVQRLGRSGHRVDGTANGTLVPLSLPDLLECIALRSAAQDGRFDALRPVEAPLDVLAQGLLGMSVEREWGIDEAYETVCRAGPYETLTRTDFDSVLEYLAGGGTVLGGYQTPQGPLYGKVAIASGRFRVASKRVARQYYLNIGTISDDYAVRVVTKNQRRLGEVEEGFITTLPAGEAFVIGGKAVVVKRLHQNIAVVEPAGGERVHTPRWMGGKMSLTARLAREELALRKGLRTAWNGGGAKECARYLREHWGVTAEIATRAADYLARQCQATEIPADEPVVIERIVRGRAVMMVFHIVAGRAVNRSLAWTLGRRLGEDVGSVVSNFDDQGFLLSLDKKKEPAIEDLRAGFDPKGWRAVLREALETTETLGRRFRPVAETGQLLPRRTVRGVVGKRSATWSGSLLYETFLKYEPGHPLVRETVREVMQDELDVDSAEQEAARVFAAPWKMYDLPRPSPFALPLFAFFNREIVLAQDPDKALDEVVAELYEEWA
jgi:ATP-dependent Lhr-like helicase